MNEKHPVVLLIVEGWGIAPDTNSNAIAAATPENFKSLINNFPVFALAASGLEVGSKFNEPGNFKTGYNVLGKKLTDFLKTQETEIIAVGSPAGIERLQQNFFNSSLPDTNVVSVSGEQETNEIIKNVMAATVETVLQEKADLVVSNIIHIDHSAEHGNLATTIEDIKTFDESLKKLIDAVITKHATLVFVSTHGNAEAVVDSVTELPIGNTTNPVPCVVVRESLRGISGGYDDSVTSEVSELKLSGSLERVAATVVAELGLPVPAELGESLV